MPFPFDADFSNLLQGPFLYNTFDSLYRKKVGGADRAAEYEKLLVQWIDEKFYEIKVCIPKRR
jgi:hypothetical protein